jgi:sugar phosphate isomerase/epimerase
MVTRRGFITRRRFATSLAAATAGAAAGAVAACAARREHEAPTHAAGLTIGVQSYTFRKLDLDGIIAAMTSIGLDSVELWNGHLDPMKATEADFKAARRKLDGAGIRVNAYCANFPTDATDEHLDRAFTGAGLLGTSVMTTSVEKPIVPRLDEWCQRYKVKIGLHNHWLGDSWFKGDKAQNFEGPADFLGALAGRSEYLSINLDIGHFSAAGHDPVAFFRDQHARIVSLHVKDRDKDAARSDRRFGEGATPIAAVLKLARQLGFRYAANIEYELEPDDPTPGVRHAFEYVKRTLA